MKNFARVSGLNINLTKSKLYGLNLHENELEDGVRALGCSAGYLPFMYLGLPVGQNMRRASAWQPIIDRIKKKLAGWKAKFLSFGGRLTLIKAVLGSLPLYFFSLFHAPNAVIHTLERLRATFFWGGGNGERKIDWIAWNTILKDKKDGGLGVTGLKEQNQALLGKWWWRFRTEENSLWRKIIDGLYSLEGGFEGDDCRVVKGKTWGNIVKNYNRIKEQGINLDNSLRWIIGNGDTVRFWRDTWLGNNILQVTFPRLFAISLDKNCKVAHKCNEGGWIWNWRRALRGREMIEYDNLCSLLLNFSLNRFCEDTPWWTYNTKGKFTVNELKAKIRKAQDSSGTTITNWNWHWNPTIPSKINIFIWRARLKRIATRINLVKRGITITNLCCPMCNTGTESENHIFLSCLLAKNVWKVVFKWCNIKELIPISLEELFELYRKVVDTKEVLKIWDAIVKITIWILWNKRNDAVFNSKSCTIKSVFEDVQLRSYEWIKSRNKRSNVIDWNEWKRNPLR